MMDKKSITKLLKDKEQYFKDNYGIEFLGIFGSYSRDEAKRDSDIDILYRIQNGKKLSIFNYLKAVKELESLFDKSVDLVRDKVVNRNIKRYIEKDLTYV
jgi:predicted nucleotidyltransferase